MVSGGVGERVRPSVRADRSAAAPQIAQHDVQRAGRHVDAHEPAGLKSRAQIQRREVDGAPVGREAGRPARLGGGDHQPARRQHVDQQPIEAGPPVGPAHDQPGRGVVSFGDPGLAAVRAPSVAGVGSQLGQHPLLGWPRDGGRPAGHVLGELLEQRRQRLSERLPEAQVDAQREEDRPRLDLDQLPQRPFAVTLGQVADERAADQVVVAHERVAVELRELALAQEVPGNAGPERAVPERPGQPADARLQQRLVVDRQPFVEPGVEANLRRVRVAEQHVDHVREPGHLLQVHVVGQLMAGNRRRVGGQPELQRERVDRLKRRNHGPGRVPAADRAGERVVEGQVRQDDRHAPVGDVVVEQRPCPQRARAPLGPVGEPQRLVAPRGRVVDAERRRVQPPHGIAGQGRRDVLRDLRLNGRHAAAQRDGQAQQVKELRKGARGRAHRPQCKRATSS